MGNTSEAPNNSRSSDQIFGDTLRTLRRAAGLTQAELAERANLSPRGLSDLERGINRYPRRETLLALADAFGLGEDERPRFFEAARRVPRAFSPPGSPPRNAPEPGPGMSAQSVDVDRAADIQIFLIADVRGYTSYTYQHLDEDAAQLAVRFATIGREVIEAHSGRVVELRGDEILAVFASARAALRAAVELQQRLADVAAAHPEQALQCGIGLEAGEAIPVDEGYRGLAINLAARLCSRAGPGEVLAGETIIGLARRVAGLVFRDRGPASLKGIATPVRVIQVLPEEAPDLVIEPAPVEVTLPQPLADSPQAVGNFLWARPEHRLVAREAEMGKLLAALDAVQAGAGRLVLLVGEPGVGKTRLAQEVTRIARERGFALITGRCYAPAESVPYYPFLEALARAYAGGSATVRETLPVRWPQVARLLPDRNIEVPAAQEGPASGSAEDQQRLFWHVSGFLQALAEERPLALLLDDLHWMDGASLALLLHLARHTRESPILLLGTYRDIEIQSTHPLAKGVHDLGREHLMERIEVRRLARDETAALLEATLEAGKVAEAVTTLIHEPTEGNAFFAQEVLRALVERGEVQLIDGRWELREGVDFVVPENVRVIILERVARLAPEVQQTLALASVLGQTFRFEDLLATQSLVAPATQLAEPAARSGSRESSAELALENILEEAMGARLLREATGTRYAFSHALTQRALYEHLSARRRLRLHLAVAETIEGLPDPARARRVSEVAYHFLQTDQAARALPYLLLAGDQAETVYANTEAEQHFRTAAHFALELEDREREAEALERLGSLYFWNIGDYGLAIAPLEQAIRAMRASGTGRVRAQTAGMLARSYVRCCQPDQALAVLAPWLDEGKQLVVESEPPAIQASLYAAFADLCFHTGAYQAQLDAAECAAKIWADPRDVRLRVDALLLRGIALRLLGHWEEGLVSLEVVANQAREASALYVCAHALYHIGYSYVQCGWWERAAMVIDEALALAEHRGLTMVANLRFLQALPAYYHGNWSSARQWFEQGASYWSPQSRLAVKAYGPFGRGMVLLVTGEVEAGLRYLREAAACTQLAGLLFLLDRVQRELAEAELIMGNVRAARERLEPIVFTPGRETDNEMTPLLPLLAWAYIESGEESAAEMLLSRAIPQAEAQHHYLALLDALRIRGLLCTKQGRLSEGKAMLDQALTLARGMPHPYAEAKLLYTYGQLERARGDPTAALERIDQALAICARLGERLYAERIEQERCRLADSYERRA